jgi:hypothetical protein
MASATLVSVRLSRFPQTQLCNTSTIYNVQGRAGPSLGAAARGTALSAGLLPREKPADARSRGEWNLIGLPTNVVPQVPAEWI